MTEIIRSNKKIIWVAVLVCTSVALLYCIGLGIYHYYRVENDQKANETLNELTYSEDNTKKETRLLNKTIMLSPMSDNMRGLLYKSLAEVTYVNGDETAYEMYVGIANYYLKQSGDIESFVSLNNEYIGILYANGSYQAAADWLDQLCDVKDIDKLENRKTAAAYYLSYADVEEMLNQADEAEYYLKKADAVIDKLSAKEGKYLQLAKCNILKARMHIINGNYEKAKKQLSGYSETSLLGEVKNNYQVVCDFRIPYYEIQAKICLNEGKRNLAYKYIDKYVSYCDIYNFRLMKINLLQYVINKGNSLDQTHLNYYSKLCNSAYKETMKELSDEYGDAVTQGVKEWELRFETENEKKLRHSRMIKLGVCAVLLMIFISLILYFVFQYVNTDELTMLKNRRTYHKKREKLEGKKMFYALAIFDIDDFKKVNDTYGHEQGDKVLRKIADIIRQNCNEKITPYRYGGEEICIVMESVSTEEAMRICESIRSDVEKYFAEKEPRVTISGGVGYSSEGSNPFMDADKNLYFSKANGKNQIN